MSNTSTSSYYFKEIDTRAEFTLWSMFKSSMFWLLVMTTLFIRIVVLVCWKSLKALPIITLKALVYFLLMIMVLFVFSVALGYAFLAVMNMNLP